MSQNSFTKNLVFEPPVSKPRATVARKNSLHKGGRNLERNQDSNQDHPYQVQFLGKWGTVWTVNLLAHLMDMENVSSQ